jgi:hypothetical protein
VLSTRGLTRGVAQVLLAAGRSETGRRGSLLPMPLGHAGEPHDDGGDAAVSEIQACADGRGSAVGVA